MKKSNSKATPTSNGYNWLESESLIPIIAEMERLLVFIAKYLSVAFRLPSGMKLRYVATVRNPTRKHKGGCNGGFAKNTWQEISSGEWLCEIFLTPDQLNRPVLAIVCTLIHEAIHAYHHLIGVSGVSSNGRHNKRFLADCLLAGLECVLTSKVYGYNGTSLGKVLTKIVQTVWKPKQEVFDKVGVPTEEVKKKTLAGTAKKAWHCGCVDQNAYTVWTSAKHELRGTCNVCNNRYEIKEREVKQTLKKAA